MTSLDKQAREFCYPKVEAWFSDGGDFRPTAEMCSEIAAAFATQVREQTVQECVKVVDREASGSFFLRQILVKQIAAIAAPPETTEQDG